MLHRTCSLSFCKKVLICFTGSVNVCKQNVKTSGVEGTITGSFTADQLRTEEYECILQFNDVPPYSVFELNINRYSFPYDCVCGDRRCNYFQFQGFTSDLVECLSYARKFYRYRNTTGSISIIPKVTNIAPLEFNLTYRGKVWKAIAFLSKSSACFKVK